MDDEVRAALRGLQESLARIAEEANDAGRALERVLGATEETGHLAEQPEETGRRSQRREVPAASPAVAASPGAPSPVVAPPPAVTPSSTAAEVDADTAEGGASDRRSEWATTPSGTPAVTPEPPAVGWPPPGFSPPPGSPPLGSPPLGSPPPGFSPPAAVPGALAPGYLAVPPFPPGVRPIAQRLPPPAQDRRAGSWADTAGLQILGWVGGGITVIGIVLLLVIAARDSGFAAAARVLVGVVLGIALVSAGVALRRDPDRRALAVTMTCTGLAVGFLTVVGATRLTGLVPAPVGFVASAVIVAVAVLLSRSWQEPWLAGAAFAAGGLLAPVVGGGFTDPVLVFEAIMVAGGAACLLAGVGIYAWIGAAGSAALTIFMLAAMTDDPTVTQTAIIAVIAAVAWATVLWRWWGGRAPADPGPFPLRVPSRDPAQVARDYADYYAHQRLRSAARLDLVTSTVSIATTSALLLLAVASLEEPAAAEAATGALAAGLAVVFLVVTWLAQAGQPGQPGQPAQAGQRAQPGQQSGSPRHDGAVILTAWSAAILLAATAVLRFGGDGARGLSWLGVAAAALAVAGVGRSIRLLVPAVGAVAISVIAAATVAAPYQLLTWPSPSLVDPAGALLPRAWTTVFPVGLGVVAVCALALWAVARCTVADETLPASRADGSIANDGRWRLRPAVRVELLTWVLVGAVVVGIYGILAVTMVLAYAVSPDAGGYQGGQVAVTVLITVAGVVMAWQGYRQVVLRLGGLALAAIAVAKLLLFDTRSLSMVPRALTFIGVGLLLLICAFGYLRATARAARARREDGTDAQLPFDGPSSGGYPGYPHR